MLLLDGLGGSNVLDEPARRRIVEATDGNPLFVEEMLALLLEDGEAAPAVDVPPTIQALLAARLDQLDLAERTALEAAAAEGKVFHENSVAELLETSPAAVRASLMALVRKELVRPERSVCSDERAYRFRHLLIRDAAYEALPKHARATLHERHARWVERKAGERTLEFEEILGYHLERAFRYRAELGKRRRRHAGGRAAGRSPARGGREESRRARGRARRAQPALPSRRALARGRYGYASDRDFRRAPGRPRARQSVETARAGSVPGARRRCERRRCRARLDVRAPGRRRARGAGGQRLDGRRALPRRNARPEARRRVEAHLARGIGGRAVEAGLRACLAALTAMTGDFVEARTLIPGARALVEDLGFLTGLAIVPFYEVCVERLAADPAAAERVARASLGPLKEIGEVSTYVSIVAVLAQTVYEQATS